MSLAVRVGWAAEAGAAAGDVVFSFGWITARVWMYSLLANLPLRKGRGVFFLFLFLMVRVLSLWVTGVYYYVSEFSDFTRVDESDFRHFLLVNRWLKLDINMAVVFLIL